MEIERQWLAFRTKARHEKKIVERAEEQSITVYCPLQETLVQWTDRIKKVKKPLFTGFVFGFVSETERLQLLEDPSVLRCVMDRGKPGIVHEHEIEAIKFLLNEASNVTVSEFQPMELVKVQTGSLKNSIAQVLHINGRRVKLQLESMQLQLTAEVDVATLEKLH